MAQRTKRQHLTAVSYLRRFADERGRVTAYDKRDGREFTAHVREVEVERDFYTIEESGRPSDAFERFMGTDVEGPAVGAFDRLVAESVPPTPEDRIVIVKFMALQYVRGRAYRDMHERSAQAQAARKIPPRNPLPPDVFAAVEGAAIDRFLAMATSREFEVKAMVEMAEKIIPYLLPRPWILARTANAPTSDLSVIPWLQDTKQAGFGIGVAVADEITMPISPERVLILGPLTGSPFGEQVIDGPEGWRHQLPDLVRSTARRYVYRRPGAPLPVGPNVELPA